MSADGVEVRASAIEGLGLFARRPFVAGEKIVAYAGVLMQTPPVRPPGEPVCALEIRPGLWLDGSAPDNPGRHANHSCRPNAELTWCEPEGRAWLVASAGCAAGEEITFDYGFSLAESLFHPCRCGQPECVGRIIASPLRPALRRHLRFSRPRG